MFCASIQLPRDVGRLLVYVGALGIVLPGIIGFPFVIVGGAVLFAGRAEAADALGGPKPAAIRCTPA